MHRVVTTAALVLVVALVASACWSRSKDNGAPAASSGGGTGTSPPPERGLAPATGLKGRIVYTTRGPPSGPDPSNIFIINADGSGQRQLTPPRGGRSIPSPPPDSSAGGARDRTGPEPPMLTRLLTGRATTPRDEPVQDGTTLCRLPSLRAYWKPGEHHPAHRVGNLGPDVPAAALADEAREQGSQRGCASRDTGRSCEGR